MYLQMDSFEKKVQSTASMKELGSQLAQSVAPGFCMYLEGEIGAGKTTLIQGVFRSLAIIEPVLSPTFSLLETYTTPSNLQLLHLDLYRIEDSYELYLFGLDEFERQQYAWFVEWPEQGKGIIPSPDMRVKIKFDGRARIVSITTHQ